MPYTKAEWMRDLRAAARDAGLDQQKEVAVALGRDAVTVNRWWLGKTMPPTEQQRNEFLDKLAAYRPAPRRQSPRDTVAHHAPTTPRTFATEAERKAYALGVLDLTQVSVGEASRAITSASAALLAPLTPLAAAFPSSPETARRRAAALREAQAAEAAVEALPRPRRRRA